MTRPPPTSTLFPYTTLFRSEPFELFGAGLTFNSPESDLETGLARCSWSPVGCVEGAEHGPCVDRFFVFLRSEEHTSELQSHVNLVCRLLLEKKKYICNIYAP